MRTQLTTFLILALGASLTLSGCGSDGGGSAPAPGVSSPTGIATAPIDDGNAATAPAVFAIPAAINANNELVGTAEAAAGATLQPAFWVVDNAGAATVAATPLLTIGDRFAAAYDLNDSGVIVGSSENIDTSIRATLWADSAATPQLLQSLTPGGFAAAYGINDTGRIVGSAENADGLWQAVRWQRDPVSGSLTGPFTLPGVPAGWEAEAYAVNADDTIAGELVDTEGISHAVLWQLVGASYVRVDLPGVGLFDHALALDLNSPAVGEALIVAGEVGDDGLGGLTQAVQWTVDGATITAVNLGVANRDSSATAVNAAGRAAGWEESAVGTSQAAVWSGAAPAGILIGSDSQAFDINVHHLVVGRSGTQGFVKLAN